MSIEKVNLRKLLQLFFSSERKQRALLLADIRNDFSKQDSSYERGGDFYGPFWADAKNHVAGRSDLLTSTDTRIKANATRKRLYPILAESFLAMWNEKMRWRNEPFQFVPESVKAELPVKELGTVVRIENTAAVQISDGSHRIIYPYFCEDPPLPDEGARLGFWALRTALPQYGANDMRIIDVQRRAYFRPSEILARGDEERQFVQRYALLLKTWKKLKAER